MTIISPRLRQLIFVMAIAAGSPQIAVADETQSVAAGKTLAAGGNSKGVPPCSACHGADGGGQAASGIPRLAGLDAAYVKAQLVAFGGGSRENSMMSPIAKAMDASAITDAAAYYASLPAPATTASGPQAQIASGAVLAERGDWAANIPPCASCHGAAGHGVGSAFPGIAGQSALYISNQLKAWQAGTRHDDPLGLMHGVATRLNADQVAAVAAYYASVSATEQTGKGGAK